MHDVENLTHLDLDHKDQLTDHIQDKLLPLADHSELQYVVVFL